MYKTRNDFCTDNYVQFIFWSISPSNVIWIVLNSTPQGRTWLLATTARQCFILALATNLIRTCKQEGLNVHLMFPIGDGLLWGAAVVQLLSEFLPGRRHGLQLGQTAEEQNFLLHATEAAGKSSETHFRSFQLNSWVICVFLRPKKPFTRPSAATPTAFSHNSVFSRSPCMRMMRREVAALKICSQPFAVLGL